MTDRDIIALTILHTLEQVIEKLNRKNCQTAKTILTTELMKAQMEWELRR